MAISLVISCCISSSVRAPCPQHLAPAGKAEWRRRASSSALLPAKPHRSEGGSREVHDDLHQPERSGGLCGVSWAPLTRRSGGATRPRSRGHTTAYAAYRQQKGPPSDLKGNDRLQGKARIPTLEPGAGYQTGFLISAESKAQTHQRLDSRRSWTIALSRYRIVSHRPNLTAYC